MSVHELNAAEMCRDARGRRNLRAERLIEERERLSKRLSWAIQRGEPRKVERLERQLAELKRDMRAPEGGYAREMRRQRSDRNRPAG